MNHYIYKISNPKTGQYYYGRRSTEIGWKEDSYFSSSAHLRKLCGGKKPKQELLPEWKKEVLLTFDNLPELIEYEEVVVGNKWKTDDLCLNAIPGGDWGGGDASQMRTPEARAKSNKTMSKWAQTPEGQVHLSNMGKRGGAAPKTITDEFRKAQGNRAKGRKWINDGINKKLVKAEDLETYLNSGWILGRPQCDKDKVSQKTKEAMNKSDTRKKFLEGIERREAKRWQHS